MQGVAGLGDLRIQLRAGSGCLPIQLGSRGCRIGFELGGGAGGVGLELGEGCGGLRLELCARSGVLVAELRSLLADLAGQIGSALLDVPREVTAKQRVLGFVGRSSLLGVAGELSGRLTRLGRLAVGGGGHLGGFALGFGPDGRRFALRGGARFGGLGGDGPADSSSLLQRLLHKCLCLCLASRQCAVGLVGGIRGQLLGALLRLGVELLRCLHGLAGEALGVGLHGRAQLLGVDVGLADQSRGLFLSNAEGVLELGSEAAVRGGAGFVKLRLQILGDRGNALGLLERVRSISIRLDQLAAKFLDCRVDGVLLVAAKLRTEIFVVSSHFYSLGLCRTIRV